MDRYRGLRHVDVGGVNLVYLFMNFVILFLPRTRLPAALLKAVFVLVTPYLKS